METALSAVLGIILAFGFYIVIVALLINTTDNDQSN